ncbi:hypothetical protein Leryth_026383 [Lithospermum erythrorhizon]|nr:hypothetical protein Leryth_026383 [Lithospermum erythrorhizon]
MIEMFSLSLFRVCNYSLKCQLRWIAKFKKESNAPKKSSNFFNEDDDMMNDEIDAFHKQRDVVPLDINEDARSSDEHPNEDEDIYKDDADSEEDRDSLQKASRL